MGFGSSLWMREVLRSLSDVVGERELAHRKLIFPRRVRGLLPLTSFETKKWLEVNFPSRGKVINFPSFDKKKLLFPKPFISWENSPFRGKGKAIFKGKFSLSGEIGPIFPGRENFAPKDV